MIGDQWIFWCCQAENKREPVGSSERKLRGIWNIVPGNSLQDEIHGYIDLLPSPNSWNHQHLRTLEILLLTVRDRTSFFNLFVLPTVWMASGLSLSLLAVVVCQAAHRSIIQLAYMPLEELSWHGPDGDEWALLSDDDFYLQRPPEDATLSDVQQCNPSLALRPPRLSSQRLGYLHR